MITATTTKSGSPRLLYTEMKARIKRRYLVQDGVNGHTARVGLAFNSGKAWEVSEHGYYVANSHCYETECEMLFCFDNARENHFPQAIVNKRINPNLPNCASC